MNRMPIPPGTHSLGPDSGKLTVLTGKAGAAAMAGHNLLIEVGDWTGTVANEDGELSIALDADGGSLRVLEGTGGIQPLGEEERSSIQQTIDDEVLKRAQVSFRSESVQAGAGDKLRVTGTLELAGNRQPIEFELTVTDGGLSGTAVIKQTDFAIKPYSALFGTLKVTDEVTVSVDAKL
jgi:hypothetical protein